MKTQNMRTRQDIFDDDDSFTSSSHFSARDVSAAAKIGKKKRKVAKKTTNAMTAKSASAASCFIVLLGRIRLCPPVLDIVVFKVNLKMGACEFSAVVNNHTGGGDAFSNAFINSLASVILSLFGMIAE